MSEELHTYIEPELEARITAMVLGEASDFETDKLNELIEKTPELATFKQRMETIHGQLAETLNAEPDEAWQLSSGRRGELLEAFQIKPETAQEDGTTRFRKLTQRRAVTSIAASVTILGAGLFTSWWFLMPSSERFTDELVVYHTASEPEVPRDFVSRLRRSGDEDIARYSKRTSQERSSPTPINSPSSAAEMAKVLASNIPQTTSSPLASGKLGGTHFGESPNFGNSWGDDQTIDTTALTGTVTAGNRSGGFKVSKDNIGDIINSSNGQRMQIDSNESELSEQTVLPSPEDEDGLNEIQIGGEVFSKIEDLKGGSRREDNSLTRKVKQPRANISHDDAFNSVRESLLENVDKAWELDTSGEITSSESDSQEFRKKNDQVASKSKEVRQSNTEELAMDWILDESSTVEGKKRSKQKNSSIILDESKKAEIANIPVIGKIPVLGKLHKPSPQTLTETSTSTEPYSTFSLNVSDVSFQLANVALLEKNQQPDPTKIRPEEFVNAFDYGDPTPQQRDSVGCVIEQSAHPFAQQRNLLRIGMKTAALGRSTPLNLTILLDNSGSMEREDREASVQAAVDVLSKQLKPDDVVSLVSFATNQRLVGDRLTGTSINQLSKLVTQLPSEGGTNLEAALHTANDIATRQFTASAQNRIVLITDGVTNLGNTVPDELSNEVVKIRQQGIAFDALGIGAEGLNDQILESLTRKGDGRYYFLNRPENADSNFAQQIAGSLNPAAKNVKVQIVFNEKRVPNYRLIGFEKHRLKKEDFKNDKVDAAEMAGEEAGNAVYQVEVNPEGEGDLGTAFVRFLDVNSGRMIERSWTIPYESQAKPFDLATPSMQLAGTAAMLGEKLSGKDGGQIQFGNLSKTLGNLRSKYANNRKVQDLIRMCEKAE